MRVKIWLTGILAVLAPSVAAAQVCTQAITLRSGVCPSGATTCASKGASLTFAEQDANTIDTANICNALSGGGVVSSVSGGTGIAVTGTASAPIVSFDYSTSLSGTALSANQCVFASSGGLICEGATANGFQTLLTLVDPTADRTITLPNVTGTVVTTGDTATVTNGMLASSYSGIGACGANLWASTLNANAAPTCTQVNYTNLAGSPPLTIASSGGNTIVNNVTSASATTWTEDDASTTGVSITGKKSRSGGPAAVNDVVRQDNYQILNLASGTSNVAIAKAVATGVTAGAEQADYTVQVRQAGALTTMLTLSGAGTASMLEPTTIYQPTFGAAGVSKSSHVTTVGTAPTVSCTGLGTGGTSALETGSTDAAWTITLSSGSGSTAATGTCTLTFNGAYGLTNMPVCVAMLVTGAASWANTSTVQITTQSLTAPQITWFNTNGGANTNLTISTSYKISGICWQK